MKILVYGAKTSDMHSIANRLYKDNQDYHEPVELRSEGNKALFFATTRRVIGILNVESKEAIVQYAREHNYSLEGVLLVAAS
ncbi:hypothetical protein [Mesorhizobium sp. SP-1A]|uniref:hypothetical protein n=1 Tax=Mesorhizobium sp. SP-1A TaxID=3077840 RepID=UPI0028F71ACC|nr:hypothetical protein [Mesorhizobium sp. SP-1A]